MCGEEVEDLEVDNVDQGSPPHVRGRDGGGLHAVDRQGITPACAGKRQGRALQRALAWDHPRMCAEEAVANPIVQSSRGSPPHVRGRVGEGHEAIKVIGITPACAGKRLNGSLL